MAEREMAKQIIDITDKEQSSIQYQSISSSNEQVVTQPVEEPEQTVGIVINCKKLNLRVKPSKAASVIYEIPVNSKLTVDQDKSVNGWFYVRTESGIEGFSMKEFISID